MPTYVLCHLCSRDLCSDVIDDMRESYAALCVSYAALCVYLMQRYAAISVAGSQLRRVALVMNVMGLETQVGLVVRLPIHRDDRERVRRAVVRVPESGAPPRRTQ